MNLFGNTIKKSIALSLAVIICVANSSLFLFHVSASQSNVHQTGWRTINGNTYYYKDGVPLKKNTSIDGVLYRFESDGVLIGKYNGWTKSKDFRYYYSEGIRTTGWKKIKDKTYYFNGDGKMRIGWVSVYPDAKAYYFSEKGEWNGKEYSRSQYRPKTLNDFLLDNDFPDKAYYKAKIGRDGTFKSFTGIKRLKTILDSHKDKALQYGQHHGDDIETPYNIISGRDDIYIVRVDEKGKIIGVGLQISRDKSGKCYLNCSLYNFGIILTDKSAYGDLLKTISNS